MSYSFFFFLFKQKTAYEMRISDWSSDVCSSDLSCGAVTQRNLAESAALATASLPRAGQPSNDSGHPRRAAGRCVQAASGGAAPRRTAGSGLADRLEDDRAHRVARRAMAPDHVLEGGIEAVELVQGDVDEILDLLRRQRAAAQQQGVTEGRPAVLRPDEI